MRGPVTANGRVVEIGAADRQPAAGRALEPRHQLRQHVPAAVAVADDADIGAERKGEVDAFEQMDAVGVDDVDIGGGDLAGERLDVLGGFEQQAPVDHVGDMELLDDLLVFDRDILLVLVVIEQFLPRCRHVFVGGEHRHQRAKRQAAFDDEIAADHKEEKRRQIADQIVQELDKELTIVDFEPDIVDFAEAMGDFGKLVLRAVIDADLDPRGDGFADAVGKAPDLADAGAAESADDALHLRDQIALQRVERQRRGTQHRVLYEHENQDRQQGAGLRDRHRIGFADKAADRLQLGGDHRDDLARGDAIEMVQRKAQHALVELVAQAAQHALAELPLFDVDVQLEPAVDQDQRQKNRAQHQQIGDLIELQPEIRLREMLAGDRAVDDLLGQIERLVKKREREQGHDDDIDLLAPAVAQDEPVDRGFEPVRSARAATICASASPKAASRPYLETTPRKNRIYFSPPRKNARLPATDLVSANADLSASASSHRMAARP